MRDRDRTQPAPTAVARPSTDGDRPARRRPAAPPVRAWADGLSDVSIAGDPLAFPHLARTDLPAHPTTVAGYARLVREIAADRDRWAPLVRYDALTRWYARLETGPGYEVWLLSWLPGQSSGLHDHGAATGVLTVVQGELAEHSRGDGGSGSRVLRPGRHRVFSAGYLHEVVNATLEPAVSIHLYAPGLTEMNQYAKSPRAVRELPRW
ncbi:cysteine dioxygenase family protein [Kitasatospora sp. RB6PN24]|uniref:cysteine dioxygenase n=1 Tax=Kitasatospora humi TaxID=2893891 RepID=UPI001E308266|nr:cysteine dioxygenase family protein [Kitasatospora humi]MCC9311759.1 cysteine dioxygenase family protein [Kitasatospora humi]